MTTVTTVVDRFHYHCLNNWVSLVKACCIWRQIRWYCYARLLFRLIVGAPRGTYPGGLQDLPMLDPVPRGGLVYQCPIRPGNCSGLTDSTASNMNYNKLFDGERKLGISNGTWVQSNQIWKCSTPKMDNLGVSWLDRYVRNLHDMWEYKLWLLSLS